ncbi:hypothetical protein DLAC_09920 [Tieghemostelium lacteum]|uniref:Ankyrin repeat protein n=1 Tax=Tieghemostelium lacteum TaxID=361077 RepID=A0A151Z5N2_TIELA|nr:hypothetical protein DLAC_09920 [Tieghemostelium lacteum]|eukprot:KYQ89261.1 hypothetical protein DLAC_09920 [Tieghemostelium lacteum]
MYSRGDEVFFRVFRNKILFNKIFDYVQRRKNSVIIWDKYRYKTLKNYKWGDLNLDAPTMIRNQWFGLLVDRLEKDPTFDISYIDLWDFLTINNNYHLFRRLYDRIPTMFKNIDRIYSKHIISKKSRKRHIINTRENKKSDTLLDSCCAVKNNFEIIEFLYSKKFKFSSNALKNSLKYGNVKAIKLFYPFFSREFKTDIFPEVIDSIVYHGHFETLQYLEELNAIPTIIKRPIICNAIQYDNFEMVKYLAERSMGGMYVDPRYYPYELRNVPVSKMKYKFTLVDLAARYSTMNETRLHFYLMETLKIPYTFQSLYNHCKRGNLEMVKWIYKDRPQYFEDKDKLKLLLKNAVGYGHIHICEYFVSTLKVKPTSEWNTATHLSLLCKYNLPISDTNMSIQIIQSVVGQLKLPTLKSLVETPSTRPYMERIEFFRFLENSENSRYTDQELVDIFNFLTSHGISVYYPHIFKHSVSHSLPSTLKTLISKYKSHQKFGLDCKIFLAMLKLSFQYRDTTILGILLDNTDIFSNTEYKDFYRSYDFTKPFECSFESILYLFDKYSDHLSITPDRQGIIFNKTIKLYPAIYTDKSLYAALEFCIQNQYEFLDIKCFTNYFMACDDLNSLQRISEEYSVTTPGIYVHNATIILKFLVRNNIFGEEFHNNRDFWENYFTNNSNFKFCDFKLLLYNCYPTFLLLKDSIFNALWKGKTLYNNNSFIKFFTKTGEMTPQDLEIYKREALHSNRKFENDFEYNEYSRHKKLKKKPNKNK